MTAGSPARPHTPAGRLSRKATPCAPVLAAALVLAAVLTIAVPAHTAASAPTSPASAPLQRIGHQGHTTGRGLISTSTNWSGYSVTGQTFSTVTATWVQPEVTGSDALSEQDVSFWVGLDGDGSESVEQIGTAAVTVGGFVQYRAWWEMYPDLSVTIPGITVRPGDTFTATVTGTAAGAFTLSLTDVTTGRSFTTTRISTTAQRASAEVIAEAPSSASGAQLDLADFGSVSFSGCSVDGQPLSAYTWDRITMVADDGTTLATTGALSSDGTSFSVTTARGGGATDTTPPVTTVSGGDSLWHAAPVVLTFSVSDGADGSGAAYTEYTVDGGGFTRGTIVTVPAPADHSGDGVHIVAYRSVDNAGNVEATKTRTVRIDTEGPVTTARDATVRRGAAVTLRYDVDDALSSRVTSTVTVTTSSGKVAAVWSWDYRTSPPQGSWWTKRFRCTLPKGAYTVTVTGADLAGNAQSVTGTATLRVR